MRHPRRRGAALRRRRWSAIARALALAISVVSISQQSIADAATSTSSTPERNATSSSTTSCFPTAFNGTQLGNGSCLVQPRSAWVSVSAALAVVSVPTESDCCSQCRSRQPPNARSPPQTACVFTFCDAGPGLYISRSCEDGLGGTMRDGECRVAMVPLPLSSGLGQQPDPAAAGAFPAASAGIVSGAPASSFLLSLKTVAPPKGYRAAGPVRFPGGGGLFGGGGGSGGGITCDFSTDELFRKSVSRPECVSNASTIAAAAKLCSSSKLRGCTGVSWYPNNGLPILRADSSKSNGGGGEGGFADVGNIDFGALAPGQPEVRSSSLAVFEYGALDERCVAPSPYSFLYVRENAPRPPGLDSSPFEAQHEAINDAARRKRVSGLAASAAAAAAAAAVLAAVAALAFLLLREAKRRREKSEAGGGGMTGGGIEGGRSGFRDEKSVGGGSEPFGPGLNSGGVGDGDPSFRGAGASPFASSNGTTPTRGGTATPFLSKQSSLERMVRGAASRKAKMRALAEGSCESKSIVGSIGGGNRRRGSAADDGGGEGGSSDEEDHLEDWELPLTEIEILQRPDGGGDWLLGKGASGNVYRGRLSGLGGQDVAVKVFLEQSFEDDGGHFDDDDGEDCGESESSEKEKARRRAAALEAAEAAAKKRHDALRREVVILKSLRDPNVVRFVGANVRRGSTVLVTEFCPRGDLYRALARDGRANSGSSSVVGGGASRRFTWVPSYVGSGEAVATTRRRPGTGLNWGVAADVSRGLAYIHGRGLIHLDIKSPNILLGEQFRALIADLGLARALRDDYDAVGGETGTGGSGSSVLRPATATAASSAAGAGTFAWAAPELLLARRVSEAADIYSLGVVLWELSTGEPPPPSRRLRPLEVPEEAPAEVRDLIDRCLEEEPAKRPAARELLEFFAAGLAKLDAEAGVRILASTGSSVGGSVGETLARVASRAPSAADADAYALTPGARGAEREEAAPLRRTSAAPREPPVPEEKEGEEESPAAAAR